MSDLQTAEIGASAPVQERFSLSESAARRLSELLRSESEGAMLRVAVTGGGCSGFQYNFTFDETRNEDDHVIERDGVMVLVDSISMEYLAGSELDFVEDLVGASFQVRNPNATAKCGCGSSFSI